MKTKRFFQLFIAVILIMATALSVTSEAQANPSREHGDFAWARHMGGTDYDNGSSIIADASGNVYITGNFRGTVDFDPGDGEMNLTSIGDADVFVSKLDSSGNFGWAKSINGTGSIYPTRITLDSSGNVYITGTFSGTIDFDPGTGLSNLTAGDDKGDIFIVKLSGNGDINWAKSMVGMGGEWFEDVGSGIAVDVTGNVYTTGYFSGTVDFDPGAGAYNLSSGSADATFISKLDNNGNFVWAKSMGSAGEDFGVGIAVDPAGNVYTAGGFSSTVDFDPGTGAFNLTSAGDLDIFISKLDSNGDFIWARSLGGTGYDGTSGPKLDSAGNIYTTGVFEGIADFDPGAGVFNLTSAGGFDIYISKLDSDGNFVWAKSMGGPDFEGGNSAVDSNGNVYTTGGFDGTTDFDPGIGVFNLTSAGGLDIFISKLDSDGNFVWAKSIGGADSELGSVASGPNGTVFVTGGFGGTLDFDPGPDKFELTSAGETDIFVLKLWGSSSSQPPFPTTPILDDFNRLDGPLGSNWLGYKNAYRILGNQVDVRGNGPIYWKDAFGVDQEVAVTLTKVDPAGLEQNLLLKVQGQYGPNWGEGAIEVLYDARTGTVTVWTFRLDTLEWFEYPAILVTFADGDQFGAQALSTGEVVIYKNGMEVGRVTLNPADQAFFNTKGGYVGLWFIDARNAFFDDFGGGDIVLP